MQRLSALLFAREDIFHKVVFAEGLFGYMGILITLVSGLFFGSYNWSVSGKQLPITGFLFAGLSFVILMHLVITIIFWTIGKALGGKGRMRNVNKSLGIAIAPLVVGFITADWLFLRQKIWGQDVGLFVFAFLFSVILLHYSFTRSLQVSYNIKPLKAQIASLWVIGCMIAVAKNIL